MSNIEELKQELIYQKTLIEEKGGTVVVANTNPSPSEISAGIESITEGVDTSVANATPADVASGKTFFAGDSTLKTGTFSLDSFLNHVMMYDNEQTSTTHYSLVIPEYMTLIRSYFISENPNYIDVYLHNGITRLENYCFNNCCNTRIHGFNDLNSLQYVGISCFANCNPEDFDLSSLPASLTQMQQKAFMNLAKHGESINIPSTATVVGTYAFACDERVDVPSISFPVNTFASTTLGSYMFMNIGTNCDFATPSNTQVINAGFNMGGSFNNVTLGAKLKTIQDYAFGSIADTDPIENYNMQSVTFTNVTPPTICGKKVFALQNLEHDFKIYVPDQSLEAYKNVINLKAYYTDYIFPVSQKP